MWNLFAISFGAILGALARWRLGVLFNPLFPTIPLGTLIANLVGGLLMGCFMGGAKFLSETIRLGIATGFLGSLTTFSTFSAEAATLLSHQEYLFSSIMILCHVAGSILFTFLGVYIIKLFV